MRALRANDPAFQKLPLVAIGPDVDLTALLDNYDDETLDRGAHALLCDLADEALANNDIALARQFLADARRLREAL